MQRSLQSLWRGGQAAGWAGCPGAGQRAARGPTTRSALLSAGSAPAQGFANLSQLPALLLQAAPELMPPLLLGIAKQRRAAVLAKERQGSPFTTQGRM